MLFSIPLKPHISFTLLAAVLLMSGASAPAAELYGSAECWAAVPADLNSTHDVSVDSPLPTNVFRIEIPSPGVLLPELSGASPVPFVELSDENCGPLRTQDVTWVKRAPGRSAVKVNRPGIYHLRVPMDRAAGAASYRLRIAFSTAVPFLPSPSPAKDIEEWEDDDEGLIGSPRLVALRLKDPAKDIEDWEDDDEGLIDGTPLPCSASGDGFGTALLTIDEPGILGLDGAGDDLSVVLEPQQSAAFGGTPFGPSGEILTRIDPGTYSLRWMVPDAPDRFCGPRVAFYPTSGLRSTVTVALLWPAPMNSGALTSRLLHSHLP